MYLGLEDLGKAKELLQKSLTLDPKDGKTHMALALVYSKQEDQDRAFQEGKKAIDLVPNDPEIQMDFAQIAYGKGEYALAVQYYDQAIALGAPLDPEFSDKLEQHRQ